MSGETERTLAMIIVPHGEECRGCECWVDPTCCHCGSAPEEHGVDSGHGFVPMGCECGRRTTNMDHAPTEIER